MVEIAMVSRGFKLFSSPYVDNRREEAEGRRITQSSYRGENYYTDKNFQEKFFKEFLS